MNGAAAAVIALLGGAPHDVEVVIAGPPEQTDALRPVLAELLEPFDVHYHTAEAVDVHDVVTPRPDEDVSIGRVWVELGDDDRATLYVVDAPWQRVYIRHFALSGGVDEVTREQVGHAVEAAIDTLHAGGEIGIFVQELAEDLEPAPVVRSEPPPPVSEPPPPSAVPDPPAVGVWLGAGYCVAFWSRSPVAYHGPALTLAVTAARGRVRPGAAVLAQYLAPAVLHADPLTVQLQGAGLRGLVTLGIPVATVVLHAGLGVAVDLVHVRTTASAPGTARQAFNHATPLAAAQVGVGVPLTPRVELEFDATLDVDLVDTHYWADQADTPIFDPWIARPGLRISIRGNVIDPERRRAQEK